MIIIIWNDRASAKYAESSFYVSLYKQFRVDLDILMKTIDTIYTKKKLLLKWEELEVL